MSNQPNEIWLSWSDARGYGYWGSFNEAQQHSAHDFEPVRFVPADSVGGMPADEWLDKMLDFDVPRMERPAFEDHARQRILPAASEAGAVPVAWTADALYEAIKGVLRNHRLSNWEGDDGEAFPLVDHLCHKDAKDISGGEFEIDLICDAIYNEVLTQAAPPPAPAAQPEKQAALPDRASSVINDACWKFVEAMPHKITGPIWNDLKPAIYAAVCHVLAAPPAPSQQAAPAAESAEPVTGGTVSELLDAIRHYGSEKWSEGNRHAIAVGDDRKSIRAAWDDVYRLVQLLATQPTAATADAQATKPAKRPYNASGSLSEYGVFPMCDVPTETADAQGDERAAFEQWNREYWHQEAPPVNAQQSDPLWDCWQAALSRRPSAAASAGELSDDQCIAVYQALDEFGRNVDHYEYGLPMLGVDDRQTEALQTIRTAIEDARAQRAAEQGERDADQA